VFKFTIKNVLLVTERSGVQDIIHSVALEQDIIEASILQYNKKKKEANQESEWKTRMCQAVLPRDHFLADNFR